jgi:hypothetical protein
MAMKPQRGMPTLCSCATLQPFRRQGERFICTECGGIVGKRHQHALRKAVQLARQNVLRQQRLAGPSTLET